MTLTALILFKENLLITPSQKAQNFYKCLLAAGYYGIMDADSEVLSKVKNNSILSESRFIPEGGRSEKD